MRARESFVRNVERCRTLLQIHRKCWPRRPARQGDDLLRAIIVLAISSLDSYLHDVVLENAPAVVMCFSRGKTSTPGKLLEALKSSLTPERCLRLIGRGRPDEEIRKLVGEHIRERTFQDAGEIERALRLIAIDDFWEDLRHKLRLQRKTDAKEYLAGYVERRHKIVHEADAYKSKKYHGKLRSITRPYAVRCVTEVARFANALDKLIGARMKKALGGGSDA
jgi:hypothetical protein